ncbi:group II intron reverse transcriptase/maturase [Clostridium sporogenes]
MENNYLKIVKQVNKYKTVQNLMCHVNKETLYNQHKLQLNKKAVGIDNISKIEYGTNLSENLGRLVGRMKTFSYRPQPVKRVYIPKSGSGKLRPLGIPAYEDKLVQGVIAYILTKVYEPKFKDFSYGFRPKKSCHDAIKELDKIIMKNAIRYVVDADIKCFFDNVSHEWLIKFLEHDIDDKNFIRYIKRFLKSEVMEQGRYLESDKGTPQGGLISPVLANVYLHYVLDLWFEKIIRKEFRGRAFIVRYADDFVCCFIYEHEARKFFGMLKERFAKFGLKLAEDKSKIIKFGRNTKGKETFDFLGFTHINGTNRTGFYKVIHHTSKKKMKAKMAVVKEWLKKRIHEPKEEVVKKLNQKLIGHYRYYGISDNYNKLECFQRYIRKQLFRTLNRRSQRKLTWEKYKNFLKYNPIANPKIYVSLW